MGLPENCYNPDWLSSLDQGDWNALDMKLALDMQFPEEEWQYVFHCGIPTNNSSSLQNCYKIFFTRKWGVVLLQLWLQLENLGSQ